MIYVQVGKTVVGAFNDYRSATKCLRMLAIGCAPQLKRAYRPDKPIRQMRGEGAARQQIYLHYTRPRYLKPGEFKL